MKNFLTDAGNKVSIHEHYISWMNDNCNIDGKKKQIEKYKTTNPKMKIVLTENKILKQTNVLLEKNRKVLTDTIEENKENYQMVRVRAKLRTTSNKTIGFNTLASHKKVKHLRKQVLAISRCLLKSHPK